MAFRLVFEQDGDRVSLIRKRRVDTVVPAAPADPSRTAVGVFAELRDAADHTVYQLDVSPQMSGTMEVFAPDGQPQRTAVPDRKRIVTLLVPEGPPGSSVVLVRHQRGRVSTAADADEELARVSLSDEDGGVTR